MNLIGNTLQKTFLIKHRGKEYCVNYTNSDYSNPILINRENWEILDEDGEELNIYFLKSNTKKEKSKINLDKRMYAKLIRFCVKTFNSYQPLSPASQALHSPP